MRANEFILEYRGEPEQIGFLNLDTSVYPEDYKQGIFPLVFVYDSSKGKTDRTSFADRQKELAGASDEEYQEVLKHVQREVSYYLKGNPKVNAFAFDTDITPEIDKRLRGDLMRTILKGYNVEPAIPYLSKGKKHAVPLFSKTGTKRQEYDAETY